MSGCRMGRVSDITEIGGSCRGRIAGAILKTKYACLRDELGDYPDVVKCALSVRITHNAVEEVNLAKLARVVVT